MTDINKTAYVMGKFTPYISSEHLPYLEEQLQKLDNPEKFSAFVELKSPGIAMIWAVLFGHMGIARFYIGHNKQAIIMLIISLTIIGLLVTIPWWFIDLFLIWGDTKQQNYKTVNQQLLYFK